MKVLMKNTKSSIAWWTSRARTPSSCTCKPRRRKPSSQDSVSCARSDVTVFDRSLQLRFSSRQNPTRATQSNSKTTRTRFIDKLSGRFLCETTASCSLPPTRRCLPRRRRPCEFRGRSAVRTRTKLSAPWWSCATETGLSIAQLQCACTCESADVDLSSITVT